MSDEPCICEHDEDEHTLAGCNSYTCEWPRLVRCPCAEFRPDRIASDNPVHVDEQAVSNLLDGLSTTYVDLNGTVWRLKRGGEVPS